MNVQKRAGLALAASACLAVSACSSGAEADNGIGGKKVCVDQYATATVITDLLTGLKAGLAQPGKDQLDIQIKNPQADAATEQTIAQQFITSNCDVVVPVGTAAAELMSNAIKDIPIVFSGSSTPVQARLVKSMDKPGGNVTGVADVINTAPDIDAMRELVPNMTTVGLIWKLGDPAGDTLAKESKAHLDELGIKYIAATITTGSEVTQAAQSLVGRVQAIEIPGDTTTLSAAAGIMKVADAAKLPVFGGTSSAVEAGGVLSSTYDYKDVGKATAELVLKILHGAKPADTAVVVPKVAGLDLNATKLNQLGITIPESLRKQALITR